MQLPAAKVGVPTKRNRALVYMFGFVVLLLVGKLLWLQGLGGGSALAKEAIRERTTVRTLQANRGDILDRNGNVFATSVEEYDLWVNQHQVVDFVPKGSKDKKGKIIGPVGIDAAAMQLAPVLEMSVEDVKEKLTGNKGYAYLKKSVTPQVQRSVIAMKIPGIGADQRSHRIYPSGIVAGNVVGMVRNDGKPVTGIEMTMDSVLRGKDGATRYERGALGQAIPTGIVERQEPVQGRDVKLTIDRDLQWKAQDLVTETQERVGARSATIVIMNPHTGEILALADSPNFDPNAPKKNSQLRSHAVSDVFEPGSTGKLFTMATILDLGRADVDSRYQVPWRNNFGGELIKDSHEHGTENLTLAGVLKESSNVGTIMAGSTTTPEERYEYLKKFGIGSKTGVELPNESAGLLRPVDKWARRDNLVSQFGQSYATNAVQMTAAVATFANKGVRVTPHLVQGVQEKSGRFAPLKPEQPVRVIKEETAQKILDMMDTDIPENPKQNAYVPQYSVGGKTGTAEEPGKDTYTVSFIGFAPVDKPDLIVGVYITGVKGKVFGNTVAAPVFSQVMQYALENQRIAPTGKPGKELETTW